MTMTNTSPGKKLFRLILKLSLLLAIFGFIFFKYFIYLDPSNHCSVIIKPSFLELSNGNIKEAIKIIKNELPDEYEKFCRSVNTINPNYSCGGFQGGCYTSYAENPKEIDISTANDDFLAWTAAVIVHETCHADQFLSGGHEKVNEAECYKLTDQTVKALVQFEKD